MSSYRIKKIKIFVCIGIGLGLLLAIWQVGSSPSSQQKLITDGQAGSLSLAPKVKAQRAKLAGIKVKGILDPDLESDSNVKSVKSKTKTSAKKATSSVEDSLGVAKGELDPSNNLTVRSAEADSDSIKSKRDGSENIFSNEDLKYLEKTGAEINNKNTGLVGGIRKKGNSSSTAANSQTLVLPSITPEPTPSVVTYSGQTRGYDLFYLMQPEARATVETVVQGLIDSGLMEIYLGVLVDGSFGKDFSYLRQILDRLNTEKRVVTLALYAVNGPGMRRYQSTQVISPYTKIEPKKFRSMIQNDSGMRATFSQQMKELVPIFTYNRQLNQKNSNILVVMLEDNLDGPSYVAMRDLAKAEIGNLADYMRNPCEGCYPGNDGDSYGDHLIIHDPDRITGLGPGDAFSLDGVGILDQGARVRPTELSYEQIRAYQTIAYQRGLRFFALWDWERQGLGDGAYSEPSERVYSVPSSQQMTEEQGILREGLSEVKSPGL